MPSHSSSTPNSGDDVAVVAAAIQHAPLFIGLCDAQLRLCFLNDSGREMIGLSFDADITAYEIGDFSTAQGRAVLEYVGLPTMLRHGRWSDVLCLRHFDDPARQTEVQWRMVALHDDARRLIGAAIFIDDLAARGQTQGSSCDERSMLASVLDGLPFGVGVYDRQGNLTHSNMQMRNYMALATLDPHEPVSPQRRHGTEADSPTMPLDRYPGAQALLHAFAPSIDALCDGPWGAQRWTRISAVPFRPDVDEADGAVVLVQDVDELKRTTERIVASAAELASHSRLLEATLSSIPDFVYAFDTQRRFVYANPAMLALFNLPASEMLGRNFVDLGYPSDLSDRLNAHIDRVIHEGVTVEDEVFFRSRTGYSAYFGFLWGPVRADDGAVELVVGVSRDTTERRAVEEAVRRNEARLRAATDLVGLAIYSWNPVTGALDWDDRLRAMWGLSQDASVDMEVYEAGIHPNDLARVRNAIAACVDPAGDGNYTIEYRVIGHDDGITRHIATSGRTTFQDGRAIGFIGAAIDVTAQRGAEAAVQASEAQFRSFAEHSSNLIWIGDPVVNTIIYRSAAFEKIWGTAAEDGPIDLADWMESVHRDDRQQVERALETVRSGEAVQFEYRIFRHDDGAIRWLRDTSFPIRDEYGAVIRIGGITEDLTPQEVRQVYLVSTKAVQARRLVTLVRGAGYRAQTFDSASAFLDIAPVLAPGCVLVDLRGARLQGLSVARELKARSIALSAILLDGPAADVGSAVAAMKAGAVDYMTVTDDDAFRSKLANAMAECHAATRPTVRDENAASRVARLTSRERDVLLHLVEGGTNKTIGQTLGISPRTVELHRAHVMNRLNAGSLTELLQIAMAAGIRPAAGASCSLNRTS